MSYDPLNIDPYAAPPPSVPRRPIMPLARLRRLGARAEQLEALGGAWDDMGAAEREEFVARLAVMTDPELVEVLHGEGMVLR